MTEYPYFEIVPSYKEDTGEVGYCIILHQSPMMSSYGQGFYENSFLAKQQIDRWESDRKMTEKHMNLPPINYNPRMIH